MAEDTPIPDRMVLAVEKVRERLLRSTGALDAAGIPYAVVGGNAVAAWVATVDEAAVRNTADVDLMLNRSDLERAKTALLSAGFHHQHTLNVDMFLDDSSPNPRNAVHIVFAGEKVKDHDLLPSPLLAEAERGDKFQLLGLAALVRMKLIYHCFKDRTHLLDLIELGMIDQSWTRGLPPELAERLQDLIDNPDA